VAVSPDRERRYLLCGTKDRASLWDLQTGKEKRLEGHTGPVTAVALAPEDGDRALTAGVDGTVRLWDLKTGEEIRTVGKTASPVVALALDRDGNFLAMRGSNIANVGAYPISYGPLAKGVEIMSSIYHVPAVHFRARAAITNTLPTRPYRSSGRPEVMFVMERLIDLAARQYGFDRLELRRRNLVPESAMPYRNPFGMVYDSGAYHRVMERVVALGDWAGFPARRAEARSRGKYRGIGVSNYVDTATGTPRERAEITVLPDGVVEVVVGTVSNGQGHETSLRS
jgi:carbon-monoxide dehydrogenase large subunit